MRSRSKIMLLIAVPLICTTGAANIPHVGPLITQPTISVPTIKIPALPPRKTVIKTEQARQPPNLNIPLSYDLQNYIYEQCNYDDDMYCFVMAIIKNESSFDTKAVSYDGHDHGLMQLRDTYYHEIIENYDVSNPKEPYDNVTAGIAMVQEYLTKYEYKNLALMCYNCGEQGARQLWNDGVYSTNYTVKILNDYEDYARTAKE